MQCECSLPGKEGRVVIKIILEAGVLTSIIPQKLMAAAYTIIPMGIDFFPGYIYGGSVCQDLYLNYFRAKFYCVLNLLDRA